MPQSTDTAKAENVTISTVRTPEEALRITTKLKAASIESCLADERTVVGRGRTKARFGGVKIQVSRAEARRAIQLLQNVQEQIAGAVLPERHSSVPGSEARAWLRGDSWMRAAVEVTAILLVAGALLAFYL
ncbi:MAG: hypothetical protein ACREQO_18605 [Candidatus Binatia bacterium]